ncbi:uncharacterized protein [Clytia hemisphaerica]|uniref:Integrase core domain-containing protein n=1 Tax=Clytia hemisphaerica TaxID=252671 RepID=A0A7M5XN91_9CNID|eukprot:TCONS_00034785-protein
MEDTPLQIQHLGREEIITEYFNRGFSYSNILSFLAIHHNIVLSKRQLQRILKDQGLSRRVNKSNLNDVMDAIEREITESSSRNFGYRFMTQRLRSLGLVVDKETVRLCLKEMDPEGVLNRSRHRLNRRIYIARGPNYLWHLDGYDKLKPYGFCIHGAIDGFSRKILWLKVGTTNNDPSVVASYFLDTLVTLNALPRCVRADRGSENITLCGMQRFFRRNGIDSVAGKKSFLYGTSTSNQRIEAWWSFLKKARSSWWINFFRDLIAQGIYDPSLYLHKSCMQFCLMGIIQRELDETKVLWNSHHVRRVRNSECPSGKPDVLYFAQNFHDYKKLLNLNDVGIRRELLNIRMQPNPPNNILQRCQQLVVENNLRIANSANEGVELFCSLMRLF